jgi:hypothetical protein
MDHMKEHHLNHINLQYNKNLLILNYVDVNLLQINHSVTDNHVNAQKHNEKNQPNFIKAFN